MIERNRKHQKITVILALIAGLLGGAISSHLLSGLTAFGGTDPVSQGSVTTEGILLVDSAGRLRATLGPSGDGGVALSMMDSKGIPRLTAKASEKTASLSLWDENGALQARLKAPNSSLVFYEKDGRALWTAP
jgi:hypothetical protein